MVFDCLQASDAPVQGLYLPQVISCCDEEESLTIQRKLDIVIAELKSIRDILCKHKVPLLCQNWGTWNMLI